MISLSKFDSLTFEECTRILYFHFFRSPAIFLALMENLMDNHSDQPCRCIAQIWYDQYAEHITDNKKSK